MMTLYNELKKYFLVLVLSIILIPTPTFACALVSHYYFKNSIMLLPAIGILGLIVGTIVGFKKNKKIGLITILSIYIIHLLLIGFFYFVYDVNEIVCASSGV